MVFAHARNMEYETAWIDAFHMPLFFFLSGMTLRIKDGEIFFSFLGWKFKSYCIPYFALAFLSILVSIVQSFYHQNPVDFKWFLSQLALMIEEKRFLPLWFVGCLFVSELFAYLIITLGKKKIFPSLLIAAIFLTFAIVYNTYNVSSYDSHICKTEHFHA